jgi:hypothetical protein
MNELTKLQILELYLNGEIQFKNLVEFSLLLTGKKMVIRLVGKLDLFERIKKISESLNVTAAKSTFMLETIRATNLGDSFQVSTNWDDASNNEFVIYIGTEFATRKAVEIESGECASLDTADVYGYPACCAANYHAISVGKNWISALMENSHSASYDYRANKIASLFDPCLSLHQDYFPCSLDCSETLDKCFAAEQSLIQCGWDEFLPLIRKHLSGVYVYHDDFLWFARGYSSPTNGKFEEFSSCGFIDLSERNRKGFKPTSIRVLEGCVSIVFESGKIEFSTGHDGSRLVLFK